MLWGCEGLELAKRDFTTCFINRIAVLESIGTYGIRLSVDFQSLSQVHVVMSRRVPANFSSSDVNKPLLAHTKMNFRFT